MMSPKSTKILMAENAEWLSPYKVGSHHYARSFLDKGNDVLWLSSYLHPLNFIKDRAGAMRKLKLLFSNPQSSSDDRLLTYNPLVLLPYRRYPLLDSTAVARHGLRFSMPPLKMWLANKGWSETDVLWITNIEFFGLRQMVKHKLLVYRIYDDISGFPNIPASALEIEKELVKAADLVFCTSQALVEKARKLRDDVHYLPNATNISRFSSPDVEPPPEYSEIPGPRIVFAGLISHWFDVKLLESVARKLTDYSFVLVGPSTIDLSQLEALPNVYILGPRSYSLMPSFFRHSDVGIIPFIVNDLTNGASPVKLFEYFSAGLPVVSTDLHETRYLKSPARLASDAESFADLIVEAAKHRDLPEYYEFANENDWQKRCDLVDSLLTERLADR